VIQIKDLREDVTTASESAPLGPRLSRALRPFVNRLYNDHNDAGIRSVNEIQPFFPILP
jgi:hypothetical protein